MLNKTQMKLLLTALMLTIATASFGQAAKPKAPAGPSNFILDEPDESGGAKKDITGGKPSSSSGDPRDESVELEKPKIVSKYFRNRLFGFSMVHQLMFLGEEAKNNGHIDSSAGLVGFGLNMNLDLKNYTVNSVGDKSIKRWRQLGVQISLEFVSGTVEKDDRLEEIDSVNFHILPRYYFPMREMGFGSIPFVKNLTPFAGMGPAIVINTRDVITDNNRNGLAYSGPAESDFYWIIGGGTLIDYFKTFYISYSLTFGINLTGDNSDFEDNVLNESSFGMFTHRLSVLYPF